jgi:FlaA1/EpsC-like NDP-sugar epimerase
VTRQQSFFGQLVAGTDLAVLFATYLAAYWVRVWLWQLGYPLLPIYDIRTSAWIITIMFPAWLIALRYFSLYDPVTYRSTSTVIRRSFKAQILASLLMLNAVFIIRGFNGVSRPLLTLIIMFSFLGFFIEKLAIRFVIRHRSRLQRRSAVWRVLLVGSPNEAENYLQLVREHPEWNLEIVDVVPASPDGTVMR